MKKFTALLVLPALWLTVSAVSHAAEKPRVSPHETVKADVAGDEITVVYGRPYTKDPKSGQPRKIWGELVPFGKVWRMGADEATLFTTKKDIKLGDKDIPAGSYSLYLMPTADGGQLIVNKQTGQWGTKYDEKQDLARVDVKMEKAGKPTDQFTISIDKTEAGGGVLNLTWDNARYWVPFTVKS